ncbi:MAG: GlsB/YeaQ/YmgE family stress response membrane protein [Deltaproteobacteria bacterium]|nr:GlsB/YeaQ/YmgE family stress response membrane protein [Deltaproteobacteria bacterium]
MELIALFGLIGLLAISFFVFGASISIAYSLLSGLAVGALARLILPGRERIGIFGTALVGLAGGMLGGIVGRAIHAGQVLELVLSVVAAAILLTVLGFREQARRTDR